MFACSLMRSGRRNGYCQECWSMTAGEEEPQHCRRRCTGVVGREGHNTGRRGEEEPPRAAARKETRGNRPAKAMMRRPVLPLWHVPYAGGGGKVEPVRFEERAENGRSSCDSRVLVFGTGCHHGDRDDDVWSCGA